MLVSRMPGGEPEVFASVQGEGISAGVPTVFVRFAECNLVCSWCDTKYTWDWEHHDRATHTLDADATAIVDRVVTLAGDGIRNAVLTGGEPLLHQADLAALAGALRARGFRIEVETNGTIAPTSALAEVIDQWNVSPKLASSGNRKTARLRTGPLQWFAEAGNANFKFVATTPDDLDEVAGLARSFAIAAARISVMPEGTDRETLLERSRWLVEACQARGFRFGTRLHVLLWGAERGR